MEEAIYEVKAEAEAEGEEVIANVLTLLRSDTEIQFWVEMSPSERRSTKGSEIARRWREKVGPIPGTNSVTFSGTIANSGAPIDVQLTSQDPDQLQAAATELKGALQKYSGVFDIRDTSKSRQTGAQTRNQTGGGDARADPDRPGSPGASGILR